MCFLSLKNLHLLSFCLTLFQCIQPTISSTPTSSIITTPSHPNSFILIRIWTHICICNRITRTHILFRYHHRLRTITLIKNMSNLPDWISITAKSKNWRINLRVFSLVTVKERIVQVFEFELCFWFFFSILNKILEISVLRNARWKMLLHLKRIREIEKLISKTKPIACP